MIILKNALNSLHCNAVHAIFTDDRNPPFPRKKSLSHITVLKERHPINNNTHKGLSNEGKSAFCETLFLTVTWREFLESLESSSWEEPHNFEYPKNGQLKCFFSFFLSFTLFFFFFLSSEKSFPLPDGKLLCNPSTLNRWTCGLFSVLDPCTLEWSELSAAQGHSVLSPQSITVRG